MKKIAFAAAALALGMSSTAFATGCVTTPMDISTVATQGDYAANTASCTIDVTGKGTNTFIANDFTFTISSSVAVSAIQSPAAMAVAAGSTKGRNTFTGHSNGGSVSQCNTTPYIAAADGTGGPNEMAPTELNIANVDGCTNKPAI